MVFWKKKQEKSLEEVVEKPIEKLVEDVDSVGQANDFPYKGMFGSINLEWYSSWRYDDVGTIKIHSSGDEGIMKLHLEADRNKDFKKYKDLFLDADLSKVKLINEFNKYLAIDILDYDMGGLYLNVKDYNCNGLIDKGYIRFDVYDFPFDVSFFYNRDENFDQYESLFLKLDSIYQNQMNILMQYGKNE